MSRIRSSIPRPLAQRLLTATVATLSVAVVLAGCSSAGNDAGAIDENATPVAGGELTYLDPIATTCLYLPNAGLYSNGGVLNQITDKLTYQNPETLEIEPWLATSWEVNDTATEYTFTLKDGVTFSDGTPLDAAIVAKNFDTYGLGNTELGLTVAEQINNYDHSEVVDPLTVKFFFKQPSPGFLQGTSVIGSGIVAASTIELPYEEQCQLENIVGSGPFTVSNQIVDKEIDLAARDDYDWAPANAEHQGRAYLDAVKIIVTPEDSVRIGSLTSGQADMVRYVQAYDETGVEGAGFTIYAPQTRGVNDGLYFRPANSIASDISVRKALIAATDTQAIVDTIFTDNYPRATSVLSSTALGYVDMSEYYEYDLDEANALLDEAGWELGSDGFRSKDGVPLELDTFTTTAQPLSQQTLELVAQQWTEVGAKLTIRPADSGSYAVDFKDPEKTGIVQSMVGRADQDVIKSFFSTANRNIILSNDTQLDALLAEQSALPNVDERNAKVAEIQQYIADQAYAIPFFEEPQVFGAATHVRGVEFEAVGRPSFYSTWLANQ